MLFLLYTGPSKRFREIPTRTYREIDGRYLDPIEGPIPRVLPGPSRITTLLYIILGSNSPPIEIVLGLFYTIN